MQEQGGWGGMQQKKRVFWIRRNHCIHDLPAEVVIYKDLDEIQSLYISWQMAEGPMRSIPP